MKIQQGFSLKPMEPEAKAAKQDQQLKDAAKMYENHFLNEMVKAMRSTVGQDEGFIHKNFGEKIFSEQLDQQYVEGWSKKGGIGLADMIYTQIKEQYFGGEKQKGMPQLRQQMLPIAPKKELNGLGSPDSIQMKMLPPGGDGKMSFRFEVQDPSRGGFEVQAPMPGKIEGISSLEQGWNSLRLDHGQGLHSELTFPGQVTETGVGTELAAGQKLGTLDSSRPALAWNLEQT